MVSMKKPEHVAVVLGMFETGLGVARSLGRAGISVRGLDCRGDVGFLSRYVRASLCPDPLSEEDAFVDYLVQLAKGEPDRPVLFVTSDDFLLAVSRNRERLREFFLWNLPDADIIEAIADKYQQYELACSSGIAAPATFLIEKRADLARLKESIPFPIFIKGREATSWRKTFGLAQKGLVARTADELEECFGALSAIDSGMLAQELIPGPDTSHYKASYYISRDGEVILAFALRKIRQRPPGFGYGCSVESVYDPDVLKLGTRFLKSIKYRGVGSAEFKRDDRDGKLKLIELNPRYWQQNALAERCGMNFPLACYLDLTGNTPASVTAYQQGVKWVNVVDDWESWRIYRQRGALTFTGWLRSLRGTKVYSNFASDDPLPSFRAAAVALAITGRARSLNRRLQSTIRDTKKSVAALRKSLSQAVRRI